VEDDACQQPLPLVAQKPRLVKKPVMTHFFVLAYVTYVKIMQRKYFYRRGAVERVLPFQGRCPLVLSSHPPRKELETPAQASSLGLSNDLTKKGGSNARVATRVNRSEMELSIQNEL
jgi:hypothetical protein